MKFKKGTLLLGFLSLTKLTEMEKLSPYSAPLKRDIFALLALWKKKSNRDVQCTSIFRKTSFYMRISCPGMETLKFLSYLGITNK